MTVTGWGVHRRYTGYTHMIQSHDVVPFDNTCAFLIVTMQESSRQGHLNSDLSIVV